MKIECMCGAKVDFIERNSCVDTRVIMESWLGNHKCLDSRIVTVWKEKEQTPKSGEECKVCGEQVDGDCVCGAFYTQYLLNKIAEQKRLLRKALDAFEKNDCINWDEIARACKDEESKPT
jgi:hypothetical protein